MMTRTKSGRLTDSTPQSSLTTTSNTEREESLPSSSLFHRMEEQLESLRTSIIDELTERVKECEERLMQRFGELKDELTSLRTAMNNMEVRVEQAEAQIVENEHLKKEIVLLKTEVNECLNQTLSTDIIVNGLPYADNENIEHIFAKICESLGLPELKTRSAFRVKSRNNSKTASVIVKLVSSADRPTLFKSVARFCKSKNRPLLLKDAGFDADGKIHMHECLTNNNREVLRFAMQLRREKKLTAAFSIRGHVYIRVRPQCKAVKVISINNIKNVVAAGTL